MDDIPTSRTTDYETNKYVAHYENFSDSDSTNNYISVYTKSSSAWAKDHNDGKLKEGKRGWSVKARDNAGNETNSSKTLLVDYTAPGVDIVQVNDAVIPVEAGIQTGSPNRLGMTTTDKTPTIFGRITDPLSGDKTDNRVASGPKNVEIKIEKKKALGLYDLQTLATVNLSETYWTSDTSKISDNAQNKGDKYSTFEFTPTTNLPLGNYRVTIIGKDVANNPGAKKVLYLSITTFEQVATPQEQKIVEEVIQQTMDDIPLTPQEKEEVKGAVEITKILEDMPPSALERAEENISSASNIILNSIQDLYRFRVKPAVTAVGNGIAFTFDTIGNGMTFVFNKTGQGLSFVGNGIGNGYNSIAQHAPGLTRNIMLALGNGFSTIGTGIANIAFAVGEKTQDVSETAGFALVQIGYLFVNEPTKISDVQVTSLSPTSAKISWQTNHPANGKVNYGLDRTYPFDIQSEKRVTHHEFTLTDLKPNTLYYFEVMSHNKNYVYDANREFKTPAVTE